MEEEKNALEREFASESTRLEGIIADQTARFADKEVTVVAIRFESCSAFLN